MDKKVISSMIAWMMVLAVGMTAFSVPVDAAAKGKKTAASACRKAGTKTAGVKAGQSKNTPKSKKASKKTSKKTSKEASKKASKDTPEKITRKDEAACLPSAGNASASCGTLPDSVQQLLGQAGLTLDAKGNICYPGNCSTKDQAYVISQFQNACGLSGLASCILPPAGVQGDEGQAGTGQMASIPAASKAPAAPSVADSTSAPAASFGSAASDPAGQVTDLVNAQRAKAGLSPVTMRADLTNAANIRAKEIVQSFAHTRPNGSKFSTVLNEQGISYRSCGENIAWGQRSAEEVMNGWMNSDGHRANILNGSFRNIGVGYYQNNGTKYWVQLFTD